MIELIIICSLAFYGARITQQEGMIFFKPGIWLDMKFHTDWQRFDFIRKPLYACPYCMSSIWGSAAYWINYYGRSNEISYLLFMWGVALLAMTGVVAVLMYQFPVSDD